MNKREKKTYIKPTIQVVGLDCEAFLLVPASYQMEYTATPCDGDLRVDSEWWKGDYSVLFR